MADFVSLRRNMVDCQLRPNDITDLRILEAMNDVPRERFVPEELKLTAYADKDINLVGRGEEGGPRAMMSPMALAVLVDLADLQSSDYVLDIGCLSGYSSAVLAQIAESVVAVESHPHLVKLATETLSDLEIVNVAVVECGLKEGQPNQGPYDVILINGAVEAVPDGLLDQLKDGGRLVTVVFENGVGHAERFVKSGSVVSSSRKRDLTAPLLADFEAESSFAF